MASDVDEVKQKTDIVSLISEYINLKKAGRNYKAACPFHSEKVPSFNVSPELQIFKCFGCGESGDVISFLQKYERMDFYEALKFLADRAGVKLTSGDYKRQSEKQGLYEINEVASRYYRYVLLKHQLGKSALLYLTKERGLKLETIKIFKLGYSPQMSSVTTNFLINKKKHRLDDLKKVGIVYSRPGRANDRFAGRVVFPLHDHRGNVVGFAGRVLPSSKSLRAAKYINTPETPIYHKSNLLYGLNFTRDSIKSKKEAVVVEGELDLISSWQVRVKNIVALKGSAFTQEQAGLLARFAKRVILALDTDIAGDSAARRGITIAEDAGLEVGVTQLSGYKDPDEMARKDPQGLRRSLANPIGVWDYIIDTIFSRYNVKSGSDKAKISREVVPYLADISDSIVQAHYVGIVAQKLGVPVSAVSEQVSKVKLSRKNKQVDLEVLEDSKKKTRRQLLEERLISLAFQNDPKILGEKEVLSLIKTPLPYRIVKEYQKSSKKDGKFTLSKFAKDLPSELKEGFTEMVMRDTKTLLDARNESPDSDEERPFLSGDELGIIQLELKILELREELDNVANKIKDYEKRGQRDKLRKQEEKFSRLTKKLSELREINQRQQI